MAGSEGRARLLAAVKSKFSLSNRQARDALRSGHVAVDGEVVVDGSRMVHEASVTLNRDSRAEGMSQVPSSNLRPCQTHDSLHHDHRGHAPGHDHE